MRTTHGRCDDGLVGPVSAYYGALANIRGPLHCNADTSFPFLKASFHCRSTGKHLTQFPQPGNYQRNTGTDRWPLSGAHDAAVRATLDWVEAELLQTRRYDPATGRRPRVAADGMVAATGRHLSSRDQDPQLHTHCVIANMTSNRADE